ncbi:MAG TPA: ABC transporter permease [Solirubrobacteraceae bacterium]|nr:ABC transporter permease [Solirubrobacteraceae bacterium]
MADQIAIVQAPPAASRGVGRSWSSRLRALELWIPGVVLVAIILACVVWPWLGTLPDPVNGHLDQPYRPLGTAGHVLGTDTLGNDNLSKLVYGGRLSLEVGFGAVAIGMVLGSLLGMIGAYKGGWVDSIVSRVLDMFLAFPALVLAMIIANYLGPSALNVTLAISLYSLPAFARLARTSTQRLREQPFIVAAKLAGTRDWRIIVRHVVPNIVPELLTFALLSVSTAIIIEASLSYLGLGVPPPAPTWGGMISMGQQNIYSFKALLLLPCGALFLTVLALNLLGDALRSRWSSV